MFLSNLLIGSLSYNYRLEVAKKLVAAADEFKYTVLIHELISAGVDNRLAIIPIANFIHDISVQTTITDINTSSVVADCISVIEEEFLAKLRAIEKDDQQETPERKRFGELIREVTVRIHLS